ncbi:MAG: putative RNA 2'-phosphotransferase [Candidatus Latescibacterota bacterium]|jgi:putative RNA 2'-phosphotransferase
MLRHKPDEFGLEIDTYGYAALDQVLQALQERYKEVEEEDVTALANDPKQRRFELNEYGIRALYGHSFFVEMDGEPMDPPPDRLYMGSTSAVAQNFASEGISSGDRYYVHLSLDRETAASRSHEKAAPLVVEILADKAHAQEIRFFARGEVILTEEVPPECVGTIHGLTESGTAENTASSSAGDSVRRDDAKSAAAAPASKASFGRKPRFGNR